jgi:hypothetical protein
MPEGRKRFAGLTFFDAKAHCGRTKAEIARRHLRKEMNETSAAKARSLEKQNPAFERLLPDNDHVIRKAT